MPPPFLDKWTWLPLFLPMLASLLHSRLTKPRLPLFLMMKPSLPLFLLT
jgi:hypothetical protein